MADEISMNSETVSFVLLGLLVLFSIGNYFLINGTLGSVGVASATSTPVPATVPVISITKIVDSACADCFGLAAVVDAVKATGAQVKEEKSVEFSSSDAKSLISKYGITRIPTVIVSGETNKTSDFKTSLSALGEFKSDGSLVVTKIPPVYIDVATGNAVGRVSLTLLKDKTCTDCADISGFSSLLTNAGISVSNETELDYSDATAKAFIQKYQIERLPSAIISKDASAYDLFNSAQLDALISKESDGNFVLRKTNPPYVDLSIGKTVGKVQLVSIVADSCSQCYNVSVHKGGLEQLFGFFYSSDETFDVDSSEGKSLVEKYRITEVPTILLSPDAKFYDGMNETWKKLALGTEEPDGWFVFRNNSLVRVAGKSVPFLNLLNNTIMNLNETAVAVASNGTLPSPSAASASPSVASASPSVASSPSPSAAVSNGSAS